VDGITTSSDRKKEQTTMCERELPVDMFAVLAMHLERKDVHALSVSCASAAKGLTETREPMVDWVVDRCVRG
jgi:hypothetical protein